jgi:hypothetical protein
LRRSIEFPPIRAKWLISLICFQCRESGQSLAQQGAASVSGHSEGGYAQSYPQRKWKALKGLKNHQLNAAS